jgi:serine/threonine protein kinase
MSLAPGARLGPYEMIASVGAGGMGQVYKARDSRLDRTVAVKILRTSSPRAGSSGSASTARCARQLAGRRRRRPLALVTDWQASLHATAP